MVTSSSATTPWHLGGADFALTNSAAVIDTGWKTINNVTLSGLTEFGIACKGSNSTVNIDLYYIDVLFKV